MIAQQRANGQELTSPPPAPQALHRSSQESARCSRPWVTGVEERSRPLPAEVALQLEIEMAAFTASTWPIATPIRSSWPANLPIAAAPASSLDRGGPYDWRCRRRRAVHLRCPRRRSVRSRFGRPPALLVADLGQRQVTLHLARASTNRDFPRARTVAGSGRHTIDAVATSNGETFATGYDRGHRHLHHVDRPSRGRRRAVELNVPYAACAFDINGALRNNVAPMLQQLGLTDVTVVDPAALPRDRPLRDSAPWSWARRAYEASDALVANNARLLDYVRDTLPMAAQYGRTRRTTLATAPAPITLARPADRVTIETRR